MGKLALLWFSVFILTKSINCTLSGISSNPNDVAFYLFPNPNNFSDFDELKYKDLTSIGKSRYSSDKNIIILTHGFTQNYTSDFPTVLIKAYLSAGFGATSNVIGLDWGKLSGSGTYLEPALVQNLESLPLYVAAAQNVPIVGKRVSDFLRFLEGNNLTSGPEAIHLVGQSLGAHASGMAGMYYKQKTATSLKRITGTDPASPIFQLKPSQQRLDSTDARLVDIVHTNKGVFGFVGSLGHVDFFVNGGGPVQPSCAATLLTDPFCSHNTAPHYYAKSIADPSLTGVRPAVPLIRARSETTFGEFCPESARGVYKITLSL